MSEFHEEEEEYFCRFTFGQFVSLALLELVALFFVFYLGARYGPDLLGQKNSPIDERYSELPTDAAVEFETGKEITSDIEYTYPETLTRKEEIPEKSTSAQRAREGEAPPALPVEGATTEGSARGTQAPMKEPVVAAIPSKPKVISRGGYSVQVGSYRKASGAAEKINRWQAKGYDAFMSIGDVPNKGTWYRVRIGNFATREKAKKFLDQLTRRENVSAIIVRNKS